MTNDRTVMTVEQKRIYKAIKSYTKKHGFPPTRGELGEAVDCTRANIQYHLERMAANGFVDIATNKNRGVTVI